MFSSVLSSVLWQGLRERGRRDAFWHAFSFESNNLTSNTLQNADIWHIAVGFISVFPKRRLGRSSRATSCALIVHHVLDIHALGSHITLLLPTFFFLASFSIAYRYSPDSEFVHSSPVPPNTLQQMKHRHICLCIAHPFPFVKKWDGCEQ